MQLIKSLLHIFRPPTMTAVAWLVGHRLLSLHLSAVASHEEEIKMSSGLAAS